jgi:hypothetical protein
MFLGFKPQWSPFKIKRKKKKYVENIIVTIEDYKGLTPTAGTDRNI